MWLQAHSYQFILNLPVDGGALMVVTSGGGLVLSGGIIGFSSTVVQVTSEGAVDVPYAVPPPIIFVSSSICSRETVVEMFKGGG